ncbi:LAMI_0H01728g1_1 [Lachancea mirantina]|uniref:LAMI_0H01728g1_1 n=1 Tax=Lachancea mirantina TaxID=1230905 RepID=A0A1G4KE56_9SACH|nr:LAMI_0H01728g1_1 [Lachancea mirantina]
MPFDFDFVVESFVIPIIRYPILVLIPFFRAFDLNVSTLGGFLVVYSFVLNGAILCNNMFKLRGRWRAMSKLTHFKCVVTGGSSGLGKQIVLKLLARYDNAEIIIIDKIEPEIADARAKFFKCDLSKMEDLDLALASIRSVGQIDLLINNAGMRCKYGSLKQTTYQDMNQIFQVNVFAPIRLLQELSPNLSEERQFYAVTIASALGINAPARASSYGATKASLIAFHESWTQEFSQADSVRSLLVLPGQLKTTMFEGFKPPKQFFAPLVEPDFLATRIINCCEIGLRGELYAPFYANFMYALKTSPYMVTWLGRFMSGMDSCLPHE